MKGSMYFYIIGVVSLFVVTMLYLVFGHVFETNIYNEFGNASSGYFHINNTEAQETLTFLHSVWTYWIYLIVIGIILFWLTTSQLRDDIQ